MAPKGGPQSTEPKYIILRAVGGESAPASTLAPKVGPMGLPAKKVGDDIAKLTSQFKGLKITVQLQVIGRDYTIKVLPTASSLIIKALKEPPRDRKKVKDVKHSGSITLDDVKQIARTLRFKSCAKSFQGSVLEILGTCNSVGCLVDKKAPRDLQAEIKSGQVIIDEEDI